jgi:hypothetical protein
MDVTSRLNMSAIHKCLELFPVHPLFSCYVCERSKRCGKFAQKKRRGKSNLTGLSDGVANIRMFFLGKATNKGNLKNNNVFELR